MDKYCRGSGEHIIPEAGAIGKIVTGNRELHGGIDHIEQLKGRHFRWETVLTTGQHQEILVALK